MLSSFIAVIGTGSAGMRHLGVLSKFPGVRTVAVPVRPWRCSELSAAGIQTAPDLGEAKRMGATHCVVATDTSRHVDDALSALENGLRVLVEKPLAGDVRDASRLGPRIQRNRGEVFVGCVMRFCDSVNTFRHLLNRIGAVHSVRIECQSYLPDWRPSRPYWESYSARAEEGGVLRDLIHEIDYACWIFGWPSAVQATVKNLGRLGIAADEMVNLMWETPRGCVISMTLDYLSRPARRRMRAMGELGTLEWDGIEGVVRLALRDGEPEVIQSRQIRDETFVEQARAFINAQNGAHDPRLATCEEGVKALSVCDAARRSSASRKEEAVEYL